VLTGPSYSLPHPHDETRIGISVLICGSSVVVTYYVYYCDKILRTIYISVLISISFVGVVGPMFTIWATARFRVWRTVIYILSGALSGIPIFHFVFSEGIPQNIPWWALYGWGVMASTYIGGALVHFNRCCISKRRRSLVTLY
jgi:adiponectin receptor